MGACATKPRDLELEGEAPVELPVPAEETNVVAQAEETNAAAPVEANATTEAVAESSEKSVEKEEAPLVDLSSPKAEEPKIEEPKAEEKPTVEAEVAAAPKEEAPKAESATTVVQVENKTEEKADEVKPQEKETPKA